MRVRSYVFSIIILCTLFISSLYIFISIDKRYNNDVSDERSFFTESTKITFLLVIITSAGQNSEKRFTARNTWLQLNDKQENFKYVFVIGGKHANYNKTILDEEIAQFQDILYLPNIDDSYETLTEKLLDAFTYFSKFYKFKFALKCDDDAFVRVPAIVYELQTRFKHVTNLYWGFFSGNANVRKTGKWKETNWILCDRYLPYALGGGYVLSQSLVKYISQNRAYFSIYKTEDVSVGTWLAPVNATRIHDPRFDTEYASRGCSNNYLITHKQYPANMRNLYNSLLKTGKLCESEYKIRLSYLYDWNVPPSKCCKRYNISVP